MLPKWMIYILHYFDLCAFCTAIKSSQRYQKIVRLSFLSHVIIATISTLFIIRYLNRPISDILGTVNDIVKFGVGLSVYWSSILEMNLNCDAQKLFWMRFQKIHNQYCTHQSFLLRNYLIKCAIYSIAMFFIFFSYFWKIIACNVKFLYFFFSYLFVMVMYVNRAFYYLFYLEIIAYELGKIENEVKSIVRIIEFKRTSIFGIKYQMHGEFERKRLKWIREYYQLIYEIAMDLNNVYGWSNVETILYSFQLSLTEINWFYWKWYNNNSVDFAYG